MFSHIPSSQQPVSTKSDEVCMQDVLIPEAELEAPPTGGQDARRHLSHQAIPIIALARFVTQIADEAVHVFHLHAEGRARLGNDILLDHNAPEIVGAIFEGDLADGWALSHPG